MSIKPRPLLPPDLPEQFTGRVTVQPGITRQLLSPPPATRLCSKYDDCKRFPAAHGRLRYRLRNSQVWVTDFGFHHSGYLDPIPVGSATPFATSLDENLRQYLERNLHFNRHRFEKQVKLIQTVKPLAGLHVLDIGCGGGLFLSLLKQQGALVTGIEVDHRRAEYARTTYDLIVETWPVENPDVQLKYRSFFDIVTLWDVIEHVNFPQETLRGAHAVLKQNGFLFIDTPCRDAFYHRFGALSYAVSRGLWPSFLNIMYSDRPFSHKQIFSTGEMQDILSLCGFTLYEIEKQHELSFPYEFYLERLFGSRKRARILLPLVELLFRVVRIRNKMIVVARKTT